MLFLDYLYHLDSNFRMIFSEEGVYLIPTPISYYVMLCYYPTYFGIDFFDRSFLMLLVYVQCAYASYIPTPCMTTLVFHGLVC